MVYISSKKHRRPGLIILQPYWMSHPTHQMVHDDPSHVLFSKAPWPTSSGGRSDIPEQFPRRSFCGPYLGGSSSRFFSVAKWELAIEMGSIYDGQPLMKEYGSIGCWGFQTKRCESAVKFFKGMWTGGFTMNSGGMLDQLIQEIIALRQSAH